MNYNRVRNVILIIAFICLIIVVGAINVKNSSAHNTNKSAITDYYEKDNTNMKELSEEVLELCYEKMPVADNNGFELMYEITNLVEIEKTQYYVVAMRWLVDNDHWSYVGEILVNIDSREIYAAIEKDGNYQLGQKYF